MKKLNLENLFQNLYLKNTLHNYYYIHNVKNENHLTIISLYNNNL